MIIVGSYVRIQDNSGAKQAKCIRILNKSRNKLGSIGDYIVVTVKSLRRSLPNKKVNIGDVRLGIILTTRKPKNRLNGISVSVHKASAVLLDREKKAPIGSRISEGVFNEIREKGLVKILTLAKGML